MAISKKCLVWLMWNQKGSTSFGYWVYYVTLTFDLSEDLDLEFFNNKFLNSCTSVIIGLIDVKCKGIELIRYWLTLWPVLWPHWWPWHASLKVRVWNSLISGMGQPIMIFQIWRSSRHSRLPHRRAHYSTEQVHSDRPVWGQSSKLLPCTYSQLRLPVFSYISFM